MSQVNISQQTVAILKSFSQINSNLLVRGGNKIQTISPTKTVLGSYEAQEQFPDFAIYDLPEFIGVLSLFKNPMLEFEDSFVNITDGMQSAKYFFANPNTFKVVPPEKEIAFSNPDIRITLEETTFNTILKAAATLKVGEIAFTVDNSTGELIIKAYDLKNPTSNSFRVAINGASSSQNFNMIMKIENMRFTSGNYSIEMSKDKLAKLTHTELPLTYFVALQAESTYK